MNKTKNLTYNTTFALNCLLLFLVVFGNTLAVPIGLQFVGRMHPLLLHFPIVLLVLAAVWEVFLSKKLGNTEGGQPITNNEIGDWILLSAALTAVLSALMGLFLSQEEGYKAEAIFWHKWTGVAVAFLSFVWYSFRQTARQAKGLRALASVSSLAAVVWAGHQGANITHGESFLTAPFQTKNEEKQVSADEAVIFTDLVKPILEKKCMSCHNTQKAKGDLIMETQEQLLRGGKNGKLWDLAAADLGLMMQRVHLPLDEKKHMPPAGKPQLTTEETAILFHWLKNGASFTKKVSELADTDTLKILAKAILKSSDTEVYTFKAADESTIKKLNNNYRVISPLSLNSPALSVEFFGASFFSSEKLSELKGIKEQLVHLGLNKMPVKDEDLKTIAGFGNLRKLNLSFTQITGATLGELKSLKHLRQLSLSGTPVTMAQLEDLAQMPALKTLQLWNTGVSPQDLAALKSKLPNISIESGFRGDTVVARLSMPILENDEVQVFKEDTKITLKHYVKGAVIRYTLDGTAPDSLKSPAYTEGGILINQSTTLKAKAFLEGWVSSDTLTQQFYKAGLVADSVRFVQAPNPQYSGKGKMLFDGKMGDSNFKSGKWLGFKENPMEAVLYFNQPVTVSKVTMNTLVLIGSYIMPAQELQVWGGSSPSNLTLLKTLTPTQPTKEAPFYTKGFEFSFPAKQVSVLKLVGKSVQKLPPWHPGKGDKGWFFIDEIFIN
ncbi:MAG: chitobiase/beta-hexosaminidase C-terminal domain-containing protein [Saprospiraceae bacterium]|nr:chitobiase/beta-hexosaminidase C-terminal domain-containing protein [Saprospiraceae bacterium]